MGAAGRDFHNFNVHYRDDPDHEVVAFTAAQIPNIANRTYPAELAGHLYPKGIPIYPESQLPQLIEEHEVDEVILAYSDLSHEEVMHKASLSLANGCDFVLLGPKSTMLESNVPVIAICAVRTGSGKGTVARGVLSFIHHKRVVVIRHPMPYGDLLEGAVQRYSNFQDLDRYQCTIEEREEYEPYLAKGYTVYAGVDYGRILREAEGEADIIVWEGGNNDLPFIKPDLHIVVADPFRAGHELSYHPGEANLRMADVVVINKVDAAPREKVEIVRKNVEAANPTAAIVEVQSPLSVDKLHLIEGKDVLVIEDGPTVTHGELSTAAGYAAAKKFGARSIVDPRQYATGSLRDTYTKYPLLGPVLPSMGYGESQIMEIQETIRRTPCDALVMGSPIDLNRIMKVDKPVVRVYYEMIESEDSNLKKIIDRFMGSLKSLD
ncbi:MAG TPA: cyclic 2,3-diphosphoglycerate synthase [Candidatus Bathyarchaeia archaeon]|nr:cyclic 2,3-diphosphoglycerate synthase [Candidatus Bathyarchaeia archaeon]